VNNDIFINFYYFLSISSTFIFLSTIYEKNILNWKKKLSTFTNYCQYLFFDSIDFFLLFYSALLSLLSFDLIKDFFLIFALDHLVFLFRYNLLNLEYFSK